MTSPFKLDEKNNIVGPGGVFIDTHGTGVALVDPATLNRMFALVEATRAGQHKPERTFKELIADAKADLVDDLGLDPDLLK